MDEGAIYISYLVDGGSAVGGNALMQTTLVAIAKEPQPVRKILVGVAQAIVGYTVGRWAGFWLAASEQPRSNRSKPINATLLPFYYRPWFIAGAGPLSLVLLGVGAYGLRRVQEARSLVRLATPEEIKVFTKPYVKTGDPSDIINTSMTSRSDGKPRI